MRSQGQGSTGLGWGDTMEMEWRREMGKVSLGEEGERVRDRASSRKKGQGPREGA